MPLFGDSLYESHPVWMLFRSEEILNPIHDLISNLIEAAVSMERLSKGMLMSPDDVELYTDDQYKGDERLKGWLMRGQVHPRLYADMRAGEPTSDRFISFEGPQGIPFMVLQSQCGGFVHRFLFPVVGPEAWTCVQDMLTRGIGLGLSTNRERLAILNRTYPKGIDKILATPAVPLQAVNIGKLTDDIVSMTLMMLKPVPLVSEDVGFEDACVTVILTTELEQLMAAAQAKFLGKMH